MRLYYPPIGIAHITKNLADLMRDRLSRATSIQCAFITQPKPKSHLGTIVVLMVAYAVAKYLHSNFGLPTTVLIDVLENSPSKTFTRDGCDYSLCLSHDVVDGVSTVEYNMRPVIAVAKWLATESSIRFHVRSYREIQSEAVFREGLLYFFRHQADVIPLVSPSEHRLRIRPVCDVCGLVDKGALSVKFHDSKNAPYLTAVCPNCGEFKTYFSDYHRVIDANTPIRTILRSVGFINKQNTNNIATVIVNGKDWAGVWMQRVYFDGLALLGYSGIQIPMNLFSPLILDESGAKLSKTIYLQDGAYSHLGPAWVSASSFVEKFGEEGLRRLFGEINSWIDDPKRLFRDYSISYIQSRLEGSTNESINA